MKWQQTHRVGAGLQNLGNTCFANAALQCLTYTPPLANYMLSHEHSKTCECATFARARAVLEPSGREGLGQGVFDCSEVVLFFQQTKEAPDVYATWVKSILFLLKQCFKKKHLISIKHFCKPPAQLVSTSVKTM